jgi:predicted site-specific integrase-resolvase
MSSNSATSTVPVIPAYTVDAASRKADVACNTIRAWIAEGRLERVYLAGGKTVLVTAASVEREIARRKGGAA